MQGHCQWCGALALPVFECTGCQAMLYCNALHAHQHCVAGHREDCARMARQMQRAQELQQPDICRKAEADWSSRVTERAGQASWFIDSLRSMSGPRLQEVFSADSPAHLPCVLSQVANVASICDWKSYYKARSLPPESSAAVVMEASLTMFWALRQLECRNWLQDSLIDTELLRIHLLGADREAQCWPALQELSALLPHVNLDVLLISPTLPNQLHGQQCSYPSPQQRHCGAVPCSCQRNHRQHMELPGCEHETQRPLQEDGKQGRLRLSFLRCLYHEAWQDSQIAMQPPDVVIGLNAGLAAYASWAPTIQLLNKLPGTPCIFTDLCEEAAEKGMAMLTALTASVALPVLVSPFRSPVSCTGDDNRLPSYSNAFMFGCLIHD